jgi:valyl-tRNA synthetase
VKAFRSQLSALNVARNANPHIVLRCRSEDWKNIFASQAPIIQSLVKSGQVEVLGPADQDPAGCLKNHVNDDIQT